MFGKKYRQAPIDPIDIMISRDLKAINFNESCLRVDRGWYTNQVKLSETKQDFWHWYRNRVNSLLNETLQQEKKKKESNCIPTENQVR